jgi:hypothetical protein
MEIGKPQINIPKAIEEPKLEEAASERRELVSGFANEDQVEITPGRDWQNTFNMSADSFQQPEVPHPSIHGAHFDLGEKLREAYKQDNEMQGLPDGVSDLMSDLVNQATDTVEPDDPKNLKPYLQNVARIVDNLKERIQDSVNSAIHPFEDWFD